MSAVATEVVVQVSALTLTHISLDSGLTLAGPIQSVEKLACKRDKLLAPNGHCRGGSRGCPGCPDTRLLLRVPFFDYRNSNASKTDATHYVIKAHSIIQLVMPWNAGKMNQRVSRFPNFLGEALRPPPARAFGAYVGGFPPPVPLSDGLDTRPCQILDPPLYCYMRTPVVGAVVVVPVLLVLRTSFWPTLYDRNFGQIIYLDRPTVVEWVIPSCCAGKQQSRDRARSLNITSVLYAASYGGN